MEYVRGPNLQAADSLLLYAAATSKATDVLKLLRDKEAQVNAKNVNGSTALHLACLNQYSNVVKILLHFDASPDAQEETFAGLQAPLHVAVAKNNYAICKLLLESGANPNLRDGLGRTPLHLAAAGGFADLVDLLKNFGADQHARDKNGHNPSYWADQAGFKEVTRLLPKPEQVTTKQFTAFREDYLRVHEIVDRRKKVKKKAVAKKK